MRDAPMKILDRFEPLFALSQHLHGTPRGVAIPWDEAAARVHELARREQALPPPPDVTETDLAEARFAVYAFVDELLFRSPRQGEISGMGWSPHTLQNRYLGTDDAGELFYNHLDGLLNRLEKQGPALTLTPEAFAALATQEPPRSTGLAERFRQALSAETEDDHSPRAALAVYAQCFAWGFRGKLYAEEELARELREAACAKLSSLYEPLPAPVLQEAASKERSPLPGDCEPLLHILVPLAISVAWYFLCADIVTRALR